MQTSAPATLFFNCHPEFCSFVFMFANRGLFSIRESTVRNAIGLELSRDSSMFSIIRLSIPRFLILLPAHGGHFAAASGDRSRLHDGLLLDLPSDLHRSITSLARRVRFSYILNKVKKLHMDGTEQRKYSRTMS
jgi:hypothetical protein